MHVLREQERSSLVERVRSVEVLGGRLEEIVVNGDALSNRTSD